MPTARHRSPHRPAPIMLVMTAADASTMPIWNAAEANSKLWYLLNCEIALLLFLQRAPHQFDACPRPCRRRPPARTDSAPPSWSSRRSALRARPCAALRRRRGLDLGRLALHDRERAADGLRLQEIPEIRGFDLEVQRRRLRALAEGFREREEQRQHRDDQRDLLVVLPALVRGMLRVLGMLEIFVLAQPSRPPLSSPRRLNRRSAALATARGNTRVCR